jgi:hypothetical protein
LEVINAPYTVSSSVKSSEAEMADTNFDLAKRIIGEIRRNRRSQNPDDLARAARALGFVIDRARSKDSYIWAIHPTGVKFSIPTTRNPVRVGTTTSILRVLEEVLGDAAAS